MTGWTQTLIEKWWLCGRVWVCGLCGERAFAILAVPVSCVCDGIGRRSGRLCDFFRGGLRCFSLGIPVINCFCSLTASIESRSFCVLCSSLLRGCPLRAPPLPALFSLFLSRVPWWDLSILLICSLHFVVMITYSFSALFCLLFLEFDVLRFFKWFV